MSDLNLIVTFRLIGDRRLHVKSTVRMKYDGRGGLVLYNPQGEIAEEIDLRNLQSLGMHPINSASPPRLRSSLAGCGKTL